MNDGTIESTLTAWRDLARAMRDVLAAPGVVPRETLKTLSGLEFFSAISRGELPSAPIGHD